ncbi:MAG: glycosyltransferase family 4 protein [Thaumarchaeota archaeon]|nr:glycosyltransferase family 4 protein [Nitrososphaerota archaeon]
MANLLAFVGPSRGWGAEKRFHKILGYFPTFGVHTFALTTGERLSQDDGSDSAAPKAKPTTFFLVLQGIRVVRKVPCDAVYVYHAERANCIVPSFIVSLIARKPLFVVLHDDSKRSEDKLPFVTLLRANIQGSPFPFAIAHTSVSLIRRMAVRWASACFCPSEFTAAYARGILKARRVVVTGNGVDSFEPKPISTKKFEAVFVGRPDRGKGVDQLLLAWKQVVQHIPGANLVIVGNTRSKSNEAELHLIIRSLELENNVILTGYVDDDQVQQYLRESRVFVFPSRREGFGLAVAEAMSAGLACVISDIPALREIFGDSAILVPPEDHDALASSVLRVLTDEKERSALELKGRELVRKMKWEDVAAREAQVIRGATRRERTGSEENDYRS